MIDAIYRNDKNQRGKYNNKKDALNEKGHKELKVIPGKQSLANYHTQL